MATSENLSPPEALQRLIDGNQRCARDRAERPNAGLARRKELEAGQSPFAGLLQDEDG